MLLVFGIALLIVKGYEKFASLPTFLFVLTSCHRAWGRGSPTKFEMKMLFSSAAVVQKGLELFFSYEILSCADAEMFDQYVLNVKLLGYLINLLCFKMQSRVRSSMCQLRFSICTNMRICSIRLIFGLIGVRYDWKYASTLQRFFSSKLWWYIGAHAKVKTFQTQTTLFLHFIFPVQLLKSSHTN